MKASFFVEGPCEEELTKNLLSNLRRNDDSFKPFKITYDIWDFATHPVDEHTISIFYVYDFEGGGINNVIADINDIAHLIKESDYIVVVKDSEKDCFSDLKSLIVEEISQLNLIDKLTCCFFRPCVEDIYFADIELLKRKIGLHYRKIYERELNPSKLDSLLTSSARFNNPQKRIKEIFKSIGLTYKKVSFAKNFFPNFNFYTSTHLTIRRILDLIL